MVFRVQANNHPLTHLPSSSLVPLFNSPSFSPSTLLTPSLFLHSYPHLLQPALPPSVQVALGVEQETRRGSWNEFWVRFEVMSMSVVCSLAFGLYAYMVLDFRGAVYASASLARSCPEEDREDQRTRFAFLVFSQTPVLNFA